MQTGLSYLKLERNFFISLYPHSPCACAVKGTRSGREMSQPERTVWPTVPGVGEVPTAGVKGGPGWLQPPQQPRSLCSDQWCGPDH